jgi:1,4-dihydroxy-2-naphthoate octaprenyltransferase
MQKASIVWSRRVLCALMVVSLSPSLLFLSLSLLPWPWSLLLLLLLLLLRRQRRVVVGSSGSIGIGGWAASQVASSHASSCAALGLKRES